MARIEIERAANKLQGHHLHLARPGIIIGRKGAEVDKLKQEIQKRTARRSTSTSRRSSKPELDAQLVAESVALQLEQRIAFRRAMRKAVDAALRFGAQGIKIRVLRPPERRRDRALRVVPARPAAAAHARADIDYGFAEAHTTYGAIGVKCWIYKGELRPRRSSRARSPVGGRVAMLMPKKVKYRKQQRGRMTRQGLDGRRARRSATTGCKALERGWVTARQIEAGRIAITRHIKRGGKIWIRMFPDKPITKKPQETRMGKGKGAPRRGWWWSSRAASCTRWKACPRRRRARRCGWPRTSSRSRPGS